MSNPSEPSSTSSDSSGEHPANPDEALIASFYDAFAQRDAEGMVACYHRDVVFTDPGFGTLRGQSAGDMWRMLCRAGKDLKVVASDIQAAHGRGSAHWVADYTFSTGRKVHNIVDAEFDFAEGLIIRHTDTFDFDAWVAQAFGLPGRVIGYVPVVPELSMQRLARMQLKRFQAPQHK